MNKALIRLKKRCKSKKTLLFKSSCFSSYEKYILKKNKNLVPIIKGYYLAICLDSSNIYYNSILLKSWTRNFWNFIQIFCEENYKEKYCLSEKGSISIHIDDYLRLL